MESYKVYPTYWRGGILGEQDIENKLDEPIGSLVHPFDTSNVCIGNQLVWSGVSGKYAEITDDPFTDDPDIHLVSFVARTYAIATSGGEAGHSYGYLRWG
jgi:hypothetical protein